MGGIRTSLERWWRTPLIPAGRQRQVDPNSRPAWATQQFQDSQGYTESCQTKQKSSLEGYHFLPMDSILPKDILLLFI